MATGFEAVLGYLYLVGENDRLNYLLNKGIWYENWRQKFYLRTLKNR
jgi:23S rRNA maturation mini-RNase III